MLPYLILQLLLIHFGIPETAEPAPDDLVCFNDYDMEITCFLTSEKLSNFSEYKLLVYNEYKKLPVCSFKRVNSSQHECKLRVTDGFICNQEWTINLMRQEKIVFSNESITEDFIKPKTPSIVSVSLTEMGSFYITWDTGYTQHSSTPFHESLNTELIYGLSGSSSPGSKVPGNCEKRTSCEIIGRNLQPNSEYFVKARVSTDYNNNSIFSDFSQLYYFTTPPSKQKILQITISILCITVIILISAIFYCYIKIKIGWWDKFHSQILSSGINKEIHSCSLSPTEFCPLHVDLPKVDHIDSRTSGTSSFQTNICFQHHDHQNLERDITSASVEPFLLKSSSEGENSVKGFLETSASYRVPENSQASDVAVMAVSKKPSGNNSRLNVTNICYTKSASSVTSFFLQGPCLHDSCNSHTNESRNPHLDFPKCSSPTITTVFEYGPCDASLEAANTQVIHSNSKAVVDYQSVSKANNRTEADASREQMFISTQTDHNLILGKLMCNKDSLNISQPASDGAIISVDSGYQDLRSLDKNTRECSTEVEANILRDAGEPIHHNNNNNNNNNDDMSCGDQQLHTQSLNSIQIDCSQQLLK